MTTLNAFLTRSKPDIREPHASSGSGVRYFKSHRACRHVASIMTSWASFASILRHVFLHTGSWATWS